MAEHREIDDDELVEIIGAGEFDVFDENDNGFRPPPAPGDAADEPEADKKPGG